MASTVTAKFFNQVDLKRAETLVNGVDDPISVYLPYSAAKVEFSNGTSAGQANKAWVRAITFTVSTPVTLDLTALTDGRGDTSFSTIRGMGIYLLNDFPLIVGAAASDSFQGPLSASGTYTIPAGREWVWCRDHDTGYSTTGATDLKLDPGSNAVQAAIVIMGT